MPSFRITPPADSPFRPVEVSRQPSPIPFDFEEFPKSSFELKPVNLGRLDNRESLTISAIDKIDLSFEGRQSLGLSIGDSNFDSLGRLSLVFGDN